ncbi:hypothetical protein VPH35_051559 [Triticum aestivum]
MRSSCLPDGRPPPRLAAVSGAAMASGAREARPRGPRHRLLQRLPCRLTRSFALAAAADPLPQTPPPVAAAPATSRRKLLCCHTITSVLPCAPIRTRSPILPPDATPLPSDEAAPIVPIDAS